jgi:hypothetical protein
MRRTTNKAEWSTMTRRVLLNAVLAAVGLHRMPAIAHENVGPVQPPIAVPDVAVVSLDGTRRSLRDLLLSIGAQRWLNSGLASG